MSVVIHFTNREPLSVDAADAARQDNCVFVVTASRFSRAIALFDARDVVQALVFRDGRLAEIVAGLGQTADSSDPRPTATLQSATASEQVPSREGNAPARSVR